jgi:hypothetical protein
MGMEQKTSSCNLDHSLADVQKKLEAIAPHLPAYIADALPVYLEQERSQEDLNHVFHLLKKYDLADEAEKARRNEKFSRLIDK